MLTANAFDEEYCSTSFDAAYPATALATCLIAEKSMPWYPYESPTSDEVRLTVDAIREEQKPYEAFSPILDVVPAWCKPDGDPRYPFSITRERAAVRIQRAWRRAWTDPGFSVCRRRLLREFRDLSVSR